MHIVFVKDTSRDDVLIEEGEFGVINNIICLYYDAKTSEVIDLLTRRLFDEIKLTDRGIQICNPADGMHEQKSMPDMESQFHQILINRDWTWDKILADTRNTFGTSESTSGALDIILHPTEVAQHFQVGLNLNYEK